MSRNWLRSLLLSALAGVFLFCAPGHAAAGRLVFVVHSYEPDYIWTQNIDKGVRQAFSGLDVTIRTLHMEAKRSPDQETLKAKAREIAERIEAERPQVVIAADDVAQSYLVVPYLKDKPGPQVIFCGVNAPISTYGYPAANVSGVRERWHFREGFALLGRMSPAIRRVAVLTDMSESSTFVLGDLEADKRKGLALRLVAVERIRTFQQWQAQVRRYQTKADALALGVYYSLADEKTGRVVPGDEVAAWTNSVNRLPSIGFADYALRHGQLCGILEAGEEQGQLAGVMARAVIERGASAGKLPVRINERGVVVVNLKTAQRLGLVIPYEIISAAAVVIK